MKVQSPLPVHAKEKALAGKEIRMSHQTQTHDDAVVLEVRAAVPATPPKRFDRLERRAWRRRRTLRGKRIFTGVEG
jgi:hypothetical protein